MWKELLEMKEIRKFKEEVQALLSPENPLTPLRKPTHQKKKQKSPHKNLPTSTALEFKAVCSLHTAVLSLTECRYINKTIAGTTRL